MKTTEKTKQKIIDAGRVAIEELIKVAREPIVTNSEEDISADRLKNAAAAKKLAIFDCFEILTRIDAEELALTEGEVDNSMGFAEKNVRNK